MVPVKTIGRLSLYRRLLNTLLTAGTQSIYSHQLAALAGGTAAQVRRNMMSIGYTGSPKRGYDIHGLVQSIGVFLDSPRNQGVALVGIGNLGRAIMSYFAGRGPTFRSWRPSTSTLTRSTASSWAAAVIPCRNCRRSWPPSTSRSASSRCRPRGAGHRRPDGVRRHSRNPELRPGPAAQCRRRCTWRIST